MVYVFHFSHSNRCEWYLSEVVIICSQVIDYLKHLSCAYLPSVYLLWWSVCANLFPRSPAPPPFFLVGLFDFFLFLKVLYTFQMQVLSQMCDLQMASPSLCLSFHFLSKVFQRAYVLNFDVAWFTHSFFYGQCFGVLDPRSLCLPQDHKDFFPCFLLELLHFYVLYLGIWSIFISIF